MSNDTGMPSPSTTFEEIVTSPYKVGIDDEANPPAKSCANHFFRQIWQKQPAIFHTSQRQVHKIGALSRALGMTWNDVADLLCQCRQGESQPLYFQQGKPVTDPHGLYSSNPFAAYLDSCSVIVNHADFYHQFIASLCNDLQTIFPHVYANSYLTPPNGHAVKAHADDRDVLVVQIIGQKTWRVYKKVPVQFPFEKEQVGKNGVEVPPSIQTGGFCFGQEIVLIPGDVLYIPRGFVHEATTETINSGSFMPSFHATVAIATHDWCLSVVLSDTIRQMLNGVTDFRKALPVGPSAEYNSSSDSTFLSKQFDQAKSMIQNNITTELIERGLQAKYDAHNSHAKVYRDKIINAQFKKRKRCEECVGYNAASRLDLDSVVRASTPDERESVVIEEGQLRGLTVRQENCAVLMDILAVLKQDTSLHVKVAELRDLLDTKDSTSKFDMICDFTLLSFARCCVELGALATVKS
jgi:ribosomal protein L16 Arg81 hydroxylase